MSVIFLFYLIFGLITFSTVFAIIIKDNFSKKLIGELYLNTGLALMSGSVISYATSPNLLNLWIFLYFGFISALCGGVIKLMADSSKKY